MPLARNIARMACVRECTAALETLYEASAGKQTSPATELKLRMAPPPLRARIGANAWVSASRPSTLTSICSRAAVSHRASLKSPQLARHPGVVDEQGDIAGGIRRGAEFPDRNHDVRQAVAGQRAWVHQIMTGLAHELSAPEPQTSAGALIVLFDGAAGSRAVGRRATAGRNRVGTSASPAAAQACAGLRTAQNIPDAAPTSSAAVVSYQASSFCSATQHLEPECDSDLRWVCCRERCVAETINEGLGG